MACSGTSIAALIPSTPKTSPCAERRLGLPLIWFVAVERGVVQADLPRLGHRRRACKPSVRACVGRGSKVLTHRRRSPGYVRSYALSLTKVRLHQRAFRARVLLAYGGQMLYLPLEARGALDEAHIIADGRPHSDPVVPNGLSLCKSITPRLTTGSLGSVLICLCTSARTSSRRSMAGCSKAGSKECTIRHLRSSRSPRPRGRILFVWRSGTPSSSQAERRNAVCLVAKAHRVSLLDASCSRWCSRSPRRRSTSQRGASSSRRSCRAGSRRRCR